MKHLATLCIGSNCPDKETQMLLAEGFVAHNLGTIERISGVYETVAESLPDGAPSFLNMVCTVNTDMESSVEMIRAIKSYERQCGRSLADKDSGIVPIDIDVVLWDSDILRPVDYSRPHFVRGMQALAEN